ncbi:MAG TPA: cobalamin-binding protein [Candidatus Peribacteraceae bacterium]|nr:cobalamin-binding protein [Candidatus Peribacteraceae bacterium]
MRIVSLSPASTEILFALGHGSEIAATDQFSDNPEAAKRIPHLNGHTDIVIEDIAAHHPDIILTETVVQEKLATMLKQRGFPVFHQDPRTLGAVFDAIHALGVLTDDEDRSRAFIRSLKNEMDGIRMRSKLLPKKPKVYCEEWLNPPMVSGNWVPELVTLAGAIPFPIKPGELSREVTFQEVAAFDPDLIVLSWCGAGAKQSAEPLFNRAGWQELRAVREKRVKVIDDSLLNRPGPRLLDGARMLYGWLFEMLH